jgi:hypothetical protein
MRRKNSWFEECVKITTNLVENYLNFPLEKKNSAKNTNATMCV